MHNIRLHFGSSESSLAIGADPGTAQSWQPIPVAMASAELRWRRTGGGWRIGGGSAAVQTDDGLPRQGHEGHASQGSTATAATEVVEGSGTATAATEVVKGPDTKAAATEVAKACHAKWHKDNGAWSATGWRQKAFNRDPLGIHRMSSGSAEAANLQGQSLYVTSNTYIYIYIYKKNLIEIYSNSREGWWWWWCCCCFRYFF